MARGWIHKTGLQHHLATAMHRLDRDSEAKAHALTALSLYRQESVAEPPELQQLADRLSAR